MASAHACRIILSNLSSATTGPTEGAVPLGKNLKPIQFGRQRRVIVMWHGAMQPTGALNSQAWLRGPISESQWETLVVEPQWKARFIIIKFRRSGHKVARARVSTLHLSLLTRFLMQYNQIIGGHKSSLSFDYQGLDSRHGLLPVLELFITLYLFSPRVNSRERKR